MADVLSPKQYTTWKGQVFPLPAPLQDRIPSAPPASIMPPVPIWTNVPQGQLNFLLRQDPVHRVNWMYHYGYGVLFNERRNGLYYHDMEDCYLALFNTVE